MIQNIKVDIIYYMSAADFEFEFNLGSCCHMRLLNDKAKDKNGFVNSLARGVSRSQIIIACGPLFGDDGLISIVAAAINHGLKKADNKAYGIVSDETFDIIDGSLPLVTPEGYFGGCIIESGNQSIILLTENRTIRKSIMKTLVHPYIEDISVMQSAQQVKPRKADIGIPAEESVKEDISNTDTYEETEEVTDVLPESEETPEEEDYEEINEPDVPSEPDEEHNIAFEFTDEKEVVEETVKEARKELAKTAEASAPKGAGRKKSLFALIADIFKK